MAVRSGDDRQVRHRLLQRLALARRAILARITIPPIPWPMTDTQDDSISQLSETSDWTDMAWEAFVSEQGWIGCMDSTELPYLMAVLPLPVVAAAVGTLVHPPISISIIGFMQLLLSHIIA